MEEIPLSTLYIVLLVLILLSGFFSSSETGLMAINKYRLRHLANMGHRGAKLAQLLLRKPDRLIGLILLGNNLVNIMAASIATIIVASGNAPGFRTACRMPSNEVPSRAVSLKNSPERPTSTGLSSAPRATVPPKLEMMNTEKPKNNTMEV